MGEFMQYRKWDGDQVLVGPCWEFMFFDMFPFCKKCLVRVTCLEYVYDEDTIEVIVHKPCKKFRKKKENRATLIV